MLMTRSLSLILLAAWMMGSGLILIAVDGPMYRFLRMEREKRGARALGWTMVAAGLLAALSMGAWRLFR
ncbi:CLC_0170 family protein [Paenibacillus pasadenensis]|uniref:CLC_0170 family protein n=1 Tax=Paenibacillus pasadenensis TaxID=217090 RepID=UPI0003F4F0D9|nr:CLC_0170 family protein [Paenibacillus pasadenensis]